MVGLAVVVDAFTDPLAGSLSDNFESRYGRRHPFMYASILPLAVSFYFPFHPLVSGDTALFIWLIIRFSQHWYDMRPKVHMEIKVP